MKRRFLYLVVALTVVLAGCSGLTGSPSQSGEADIGDQATGIDNGSQSTVDAPDPAVTVSVTAVVDGDTVRVAYENGTTDTVRLIGVDTPEVHTENDPAEFEGVPETDAGESCLRGAGTNASTVAKQQLLGETVGLAFDPNLDRRGYYDRLLAYVVIDGTLYNYRIVATGNARVYDSDFSRADSFYAAEETARRDRQGLWRCAEPGTVSRTPVADGGTVTESPGGLAVTEIHADAAGNDNENLTLDPSATVTLYTGSGTDTSTERYWGRSGAVWNNDGDTVIVRNASGEIVLRRSY